MMQLDEFPPLFIRTVALVHGLVWGSFLNVVIYRSPRGMSVAFPASHCPSCGVPVRPYDNIPVVSYLLLRGRTRCCGEPLSARYPLVELIGGAVSVAVAEALLRGLGPETSALKFLALYVAELALVLGLVAAAFIDAEHMYLPDLVTLGGALLGLATATLRGMRFLDAGLGAIAGFVMVWLPFIVLYTRLRGRPGMGLGDAKLTLLAGAWFGAGGAAFVLLAGAVQGTLGAGVILLAKGRIEEPEAVRADRLALQEAAAAGDEDARAVLSSDPLGAPQAEGVAQARLPFGPFLILGCLEFLFFGDRVAGLYREWLLP